MASGQSARGDVRKKGRRLPTLKGASDEEKGEDRDANIERQQ